MVHPEIFDDPISASMTTDRQGDITLQTITWQEQHYTIVATGRQWNEDDGRHLLVEAADGTRFELQLGRQDLIWYVKKVWRGQIIA